MSDIVERLRDLGDHASFEPSAYHAAADEITRLRAENERLMKKCEVLEAAWRRVRSGPIWPRRAQGD